MTKLHSKLITQVPLFRTASPAFLKALVMVLKPQVALPGDYIVREGEDADMMVFLHDGSVVATTKSDPSDRVVMFKGSFFGEEVLLTTNPKAVMRRTKSIRALDLCHLYVLTALEYRRVISGFPEYLTMMREAAERRLEVAALRLRLRQTLAEVEDKVEVEGDDDDPAVVAKRLAYLHDNPEAILAAIIMQRGWRHFKWVEANGWRSDIAVAHRLQQASLFKKLFFAMKNRQMTSIQYGMKRASVDAGSGILAGRKALDSATAAASAAMHVRSARFNVNKLFGDHDKRISALGRSQNQMRSKLLKLREKLGKR